MILNGTIETILFSDRQNISEKNQNKMEGKMNRMRDKYKIMKDKCFFCDN